VLAIRGIGTGIAGTTACLSGVEHLVIHMLDMHAAARGLETGLHGAQVGVASLIAAAAWEHLRARLTAESPARRPIDRASAKAAVLDAFAHLDPSGALGSECWADCARKLDAIDDAATSGRLDAVLAELPALLAAGEPALMSVDDLAAALRVAGSAAAPGELQAWLTDDIWTWAVANCHRMRNRVTVIDLLDALGWWQADDIDTVLHRARQAAEGVPA
jgi:glycerol-1-phosphate dehydrogenase [NAD(P)+]